MALAENREDLSQVDQPSRMPRIMIKRSSAVKLALVVGVIALGITAVAQDRPSRRRSGDPIVTLEGQKGGKIKITVDVPGKELLSITIKAEDEKSIRVGNTEENFLKASKISIPLGNEDQKSFATRLTDHDGKTK